MSCERYWREGVLLVERGEPDPHRDICVVCRHEHQARGAITQALPLVGASAGDTTWEARVWSRIARLERPRPRRRWYMHVGFATACAAVLMCWAIRHRIVLDDMPTRINVVSSEIAMRSTSPRVGDRVRITVKPTNEVRIYCADRLVLRCPAGASAAGCSSDAQGMVAVGLLAVAGEYRLVVITGPTAEPVGRLDRDLETVVAAGGDYQITELRVR